MLTFLFIFVKFWIFLASAIFSCIIRNKTVNIIILLFISGYSFDKHDKNQGNCNFSSLAAILE